MPTPYIEDQQEYDAEQERNRIAAEEDAYRNSAEGQSERAARQAEFDRDPDAWYRSHGYTQRSSDGVWETPSQDDYENTRPGAIINNPNQLRMDAYENLTGLYNQAPTADDLDVFYEELGNTDEYGNLIGDGSQISQRGQGEGAQQRVMDALQSLSDQGGYTDADRSMQAAMGAQNAQQVGAQNQAAMRGQYARGMGGGGGTLASALSGSQGLASANAMGNAQLQQAAMQRLMSAYGMQGNLAGQQNSQQLARQQALDSYNQRQLDWRRQRGAANTAMRNQSRESSSAARQQAWENRRSALAERNQQFIGGTGSGAPQRNDVGSAIARGIGAGTSTLASFFGGGGRRD